MTDLRFLLREQRETIAEPKTACKCCGEFLEGFNYRYCKGCSSRVCIGCWFKDEKKCSNCVAFIKSERSFSNKVMLDELVEESIKELNRVFACFDRKERIDAAKTLIRAKMKNIFEYNEI